MKMTSKLKLPPLLLMMICHYPNGCKKSDCDVLVHYEYDAYATVEDNDIVTTKAQID
jgi:hypothetical protein